MMEDCATVYGVSGRQFLEQMKHNMGQAGNIDACCPSAFRATVSNIASED